LTQHIDDLPGSSENRTTQELNVPPIIKPAAKKQPQVFMNLLVPERPKAPAPDGESCMLLFICMVADWWIL
jgi:hypothetical protein